MTPGNFNWFIHSMLFYHTKYVLKRQRLKQKKADDEDEDLGLDENSEEESDTSSEEESNDS
jgi:hypothetical protein